MGTTLTGTTPQTTYDSLIKVTDNAPLTGSLKTLTDGLGNDSALALSTGAASVTGTLAVSSNLTVDTDTLFVDATNNRVGVGTTSPDDTLHLNKSGAGLYNATHYTNSNSTANFFVGIGGSSVPNGGLQNNAYVYNAGASAIVFGTSDTERMRITASGAVGIGTSTIFYKLQANTESTDNAVIAGFVNPSSANNTTKGASISLGLADTVGNVKDAAFLRAYAANANVTQGGLAIDVRKSDTTPSEVARFTSAGDLSITSGNILLSSAGGIYFDNAASKYLDDYEFGTWTPTISFGGASVGLTYASSRAGQYTKVGRQVTLTAYILLTNKGTSTGAASIGGLPFVIGGTSGYYSSVSFSAISQISYVGMLQGYGEINTQRIDLVETTEAGTQSNITDADFTNATQLLIHFTYFV